MKSSPSTIFLAASLAFVDPAAGFSNPSRRQQQPLRCETGVAVAAMGATAPENASEENRIGTGSSRRQWFEHCSKTVAVAASTLAAVGLPFAASADEGQKYFAPGGTLVDYKVGVTVGDDGM